MSSAARNPEFERLTQRQTATFARNTPYHSLELPDGRVIPGIIPVENLRARFNAFPIPADLRGKRVLDVGAASGWNSFELERRGADVVAIDCVEFEEFVAAKRLLNSKVEYRVIDVDEISPRTLGRFDYVIFFGVLYHLRHPLLALEKICALTREAAFVESFVIDSSAKMDGPYLEFYETTELGGQIDNWFGPTRDCLTALCRSAGFARVDFLYVDDRRAGVTCWRKWDSATFERATNAPPLLRFAVNNRLRGNYFHEGKDEYISLYFDCRELLEKAGVFVEIDGYGVPALTIASTREHQWQVDVRVPPELDPGIHDVRIATSACGRSNALQLEMLSAGAVRRAISFQAAGPATAPAPRLIAVENTLDGSREFHGYRAEHMACHFECDESLSGASDVDLQIDGESIPLLALGLSSPGVWQVNVALPHSLAPGRRTVRVRTANSPLSNAADITYAPDAVWDEPASG